MSFTESTQLWIRQLKIMRQLGIPLDKLELFEKHHLRPLQLLHLKVMSENLDKKGNIETRCVFEAVNQVRQIKRTANIQYLSELKRRGLVERVYTGVFRLTKQGETVLREFFEG